MKFCSKCKAEKPKTEFSKRKASKDGLKPLCKACDSAYHAANAESRNAKSRAYNAANAESIRAYARVYHAKNAESRNAKSRKWHAENPEYRRTYYIENAERLKEYWHAWYKANHEKHSAKLRNRRATARSAEGKHTAADVKAIFDSQQGKCANCTNKLFMSGIKKFHVDHIVPLSRGGGNGKYNLQCLCPSCNLRKHAKDPMVWANENGRLL